jgi:hypothetical protein
LGAARQLKSAYIYAGTGRAGRTFPARDRTEKEKAAEPPNRNAPRVALVGSHFAQLGLLNLGFTKLLPRLDLVFRHAFRPGNTVQPFRRQTVKGNVAANVFDG